MAVAGLELTFSIDLFDNPVLTEIIPIKYTRFQWMVTDYRTYLYRSLARILVSAANTEDAMANKSHMI